MTTKTLKKDLQYVKEREKEATMQKMSNIMNRPGRNSSSVGEENKTHTSKTTDQ